MLIAIDIGNTTITIGLLNKQAVKKVYRIETAASAPVIKAELRKAFRSCRRQARNIQAVVICSVVPKILKVVRQAAKSEFPSRVRVIGEDLRVPLINRYRSPKQVGQDRLVGAYAAMVSYGAPVIIIDFGTAITFDVVSAKKEYLGGIIIPGIRLSAESLFKKTALLPKISIQSPESLIGRDTKNSILSGLFYGYGAMCKGLIQQIRASLKSNPKVIITGGHTQLMKKYLNRSIDAIDEHLILKGISLVLDRGQRP